MKTKKPKKKKSTASTTVSNSAFMASIGEIVEPQFDGTDKAMRSVPVSLLCEHANEKPVVCECPVTCYCKSKTCRAAEYTPGLTARQMMELRVAAIPFAPYGARLMGDFSRRDPELNFFYR